MTRRMRIALAAAVGTAMLAIGLLNVAAVAGRRAIAVLTPRRTLTAGTPLTRGTLTEREMSPADMLAGELVASDLPAGRVAAETLYAGEPILAPQTRAIGQLPSGPTIPRGTVSVPVELSSAAVGEPWPLAGMVVGFLGSPSPVGGDELLTADAEVLAIRRVTENGSTEAELQVAVPVRAALILEAAARAGAIWLAHSGGGTSR